MTSIQPSEFATWKGEVRPMPETTITDAPAEQFAPGSFGCHEALQMALVFGEMVEAYLCDHEAVKANPAWLALADKAQQALFELYLSIGAEHLQAPPPEPRR
jgi:hypothetical protein